MSDEAISSPPRSGGAGGGAATPGAAHTRSADWHDIPISRRTILDAVVERLADEEQAPFRAVAELLGALLHHELRGRLDQMKALYAPLDPDRDRRFVDPLGEAQRDQHGHRLAALLREVLQQGNYQPLGNDEITQAFRERSIFPIDVVVDFDVFDDLVVYARGLERREIQHKRFFGLLRTRRTVEVYERVCLYARFKAEHELRAKQLASLGTEPGCTLLKLFRNIPRADLEMLFPNTRIKMRLTDKLLLGVPAILGGVPVLIKAAPAAVALGVLIGIEVGKVNEASIVAGLSGLVGLAVFLGTQWNRVKGRQLVFMKALSDNLYFLNLDNNAGVLTRLVDEAEEEEHKEALLAYAFLSAQPATPAELDQRIEQWLADRFGLGMDFEIEDALAKLERLGLCTREDTKLRALPLAEALPLLQQRWSRLF